MVKLADVPSVIELRDACSEVRPAVRTLVDAVGEDVVEPAAECALEARAAAALERYQRAVVDANADAHAEQNRNLSDGIRAEAQLAATDVGTPDVAWRFAALH
jgi:hypothetical protein